MPLGRSGDVGDDRQACLIKALRSLLARLLEPKVIMADRRAIQDEANSRDTNDEPWWLLVHSGLLEHPLQISCDWRASRSSIAAPVRGYLDNANCSDEPHHPDRQHFGFSEYGLILECE